MTKLLHTKSKIFFPNSYVVRIEYGEGFTDIAAEAEYRKIIRAAYKLIHGTWGYSALHSELTNESLDSQSNGISYQDWVYSFRAYFCFKDEMDALQFRLTIEARAIQVVMWPKNTLFTIHEIVETAASNTSDILSQT